MRTNTKTKQTIKLLTPAGLTPAQNARITAAQKRRWEMVTKAPNRTVVNLEIRTQADYDAAKATLEQFDKKHGLLAQLGRLKKDYEAKRKFIRVDGVKTVNPKYKRKVPAYRNIRINGVAQRVSPKDYEEFMTKH